YIKIGENIGFEQSGKGDMFLRPVVVLKKFNNDFFMGVPLTTTLKKGIYYFEFEFTNKKSNAILSQMKPFDTKRIKHKIGVINKEDFKNLKARISDLYGVVLASPKDEDDPEGICK
ncbi:MAG: type II toxin-antitoxin system PemK/MazF family toxin, partial [Campylobacterota bacterium]|nr:type II toxin-antitoxin system PemK/MazF family toxin [Campylobacterota bacterium]